MVWILEHQSGPHGAVHPAALRIDQAADHPEQGALAAPVAAYQHPESWGSDLDAAAIKRLGSAGPTEADPIKAKRCLLRVGLFHRQHFCQASREKPGRFVPPLAAVFS